MALRLYTSNASPFCLKIMVLLHELKMTRQVALDYSVKAFPTFQSTAHSHLAPLGKIPALAVQVDSEEVPRVLFGSQVIAQYLDSLARDKALPAAGLERFEALATESLADGICEAALSLRYERLERASSHFARQIVLPAELLWADWVSGQLSKITRAIPLLSKKATQIDPLSETLPLAGISAAISLYYVDRRAPDSKWRELEGGPELDEWYKRIQERASFRETPFLR